MPMRDDAVHVAVGGVLLTIAVGVMTAAVIAVGTSQAHDWCASWFWALTVPSAGVALGGAYSLTAPWHGAKFLPSTLREKATKPDLKLEHIALEKVLPDRTVFAVGLKNDGPVNVPVNLKVLVPDYAEFISKSDREGGNLDLSKPPNKTSDVLKGVNTESIYWLGEITIPCRTDLPFFFTVGTTPKRVLVRVKIWGTVLPRDQWINKTVFIGDDL